jgi:hypothetical protein
VQRTRLPRRVYVPDVLDSPGAIDLFIDAANRNAKVFFSILRFAQRFSIIFRYQ